ncbi:MAG: hypothetical protein LLF89_10185 [Spirochaetaceae bacterium]|nr:hypothetical protein [Spirochaetaceae bacterium]
MELAKHDYDIDGWVKDYIGAVRTDSSGEDEVLSDKLRQVAGLSLTAMNIGDIASTAGLSPDTVRAERARGPFKDAYGKMLSRAINEILTRTIMTAIQRVEAYVTCPEDGRPRIIEQAQSEMGKNFAHVETLNPNFLSGVIGLISMFIQEHREIQKIMVTGRDLKQADLLHTFARQYLEAIRRTKPKSIDGDRFARGLFILVVLEIYRNCALPLIRNFRQKIRTDFRRFKGVDRLRQLADQWLESARFGLTQAMAETIIDSIEHFHGDREAALEGVFEDLLLFDAYYHVDTPPTAREER